MLLSGSVFKKDMEHIMTVLCPDSESISPESAGRKMN